MSHREPLAQLVEHLTFNQGVEGSSPSWLTSFIFPERAVVVEWQTRYLEGVVGVCPWRFESSLPHHNHNNDSPCDAKDFFVFKRKTKAHRCREPRILTGTSQQQVRFFLVNDFNKEYEFRISRNIKRYGVDPGAWR